MDRKHLDELMCKIQSGDEDSFTVFYNMTYKYIFSFIYTYTKNWHTTEDLLQDTYIKIKLNVSKYRLGTNALAWVLQIAKNVSIDHLRSYNDSLKLELNDNIIGKNEDLTTKMSIYNIINKYIADIDRQIIILHIIYGYKNREIAKILEIPLGTVLWKYNKSIKKLKEILEKEDYL
ncbi:MAG: RNA polymerase sigma factor [Clostridia bacterium]|nr:RNA polymerase sigma factor [Clostridia bacterium]